MQSGTLTSEHGQLAGRPFYHVGGTVPWDADCYINRSADRDLLETLRRGEFCYVLTARQMGKSSLMTRTAARLRDEGAAVAVVDLTAFGRNLAPEQWYDLILARIGRELNLEDELEDFWLDNERLPPLARFTAALEKVVLRRVAAPIVLFIDEIDVVRSLPFDSDELLAAIRELYSRRSREPELRRLTFCLLGVASPSDLIADERITPFNIGRRIELKDFSPEEASLLADGFSSAGAFRGGSRERKAEARRVLSRVLYWTGGHPYLTQRLCSELASAAGGPGKLRGNAVVDETCARLFFGTRAAESEDNLRFVADRLLRCGNVGHLLDLYVLALDRSGLLDDETDPQIATLRLSGVVRSVDGRLRVRNRIYARVFNHAWIERQRDPADVRRQRQAYRKGRNRALALAAVIITLVVGLAIYAFGEARRADRERRGSLIVADIADRASYTASVNLLQREFESGQFGHVASLLADTRNSKHRGWEWGYWQKLMHQEEALLLGHSKSVVAAAWSPDSRLVVSCSYDSTARVWEGSTGRPLSELRGGHGLVLLAVWSPDGKEVLTAEEDGAVRLWDPLSGTARAVLKGHEGTVFSASWSPDGQHVLTGGNDRSVRLWDAVSGRLIALLPGHTAPVRTTSWAPGGSRFLSAGEDGTLRVWSLSERRSTQVWKHPAAVQTAAWAPDGHAIASVSADRIARIWEPGRREPISLSGHRKPLVGAAWSPDSRLVLTGSSDHTILAWDAHSGRRAAAINTRNQEVKSVGWSPDGRRIIAALADNTARIWDYPSGRERAVLKHAATVRTAAWSPDGSAILTTGEDEAVRVWSARPAPDTTVLSGHQRRVRAVDWSPDGERLLSVSEDHTVRVWSRTGAALATLGGAADPYVAAAWSPDGRRIAAAGPRHTGALWNAGADGRPVLLGGRAPEFRTVATPQSAQGHGGRGERDGLTPRGPGSSGRPDRASVGWSTDGRYILTAGYDDRVWVWDGGSGQALYEFRPNGGVVFAASWSPRGPLLAAACNDVTTRIWDLTGGAPRPTALSASQGSVRVASWSRDGQQIVTSTEESNPRVWRRASEPRKVVIDGRERTVMLEGWIQRAGFKGHAGLIRTIDWAGDGKRVVTASEDHTACVWNTETGARLAQLKGHAGAVLMAEWSPDGRQIVTASLDGTARVWDAVTGRELIALKHPGTVWQARWSPDGRCIATACDDHQARIWVSDPRAGEREPSAHGAAIR